MSERLEHLSRAGVAVWMDFIARDWLEKGELRRLRDDASVVGVTSNPTIFQNAMGEGDAYDDDLEALAKKGLDAHAVFEALALQDIRTACDDLASVYEASDGVDGYVSFELPPDIAHDASSSATEARRLFDDIDRRNVMIKIPATIEGVDAVRKTIAAGINVNVTLIFSIARYRAVMEAYVSGLEELAASGGDLHRIASVASFFVSRVDTLIDPQLQAVVSEGGERGERAKARLSTAAIDNARLAYEAFEKVFSGPRWDALRAKGARVQRPLWASTSTKNPALRDVIYVEELIGPHTVNTMPLATVEAFADHGEVRGATVTEGRERAHTVWSELAELGISEEQIGDHLEREGLEKFSDSYRAVVESVDRKRQSMTS